MAFLCLPLDSPRPILVYRPSSMLANVWHPDRIIPTRSPRAHRTQGSAPLGHYYLQRCCLDLLQIRNISRASLRRQDGAVLRHLRLSIATTPLSAWWSYMCWWKALEMLTIRWEAVPGAPKYYYVNESSYLAEWSRYIDYYLFFYCALGEVRTVDFVISFARQQAKERASALTISRIAATKNQIATMAMEARVLSLLIIVATINYPFSASFIRHSLKHTIGGKCHRTSSHSIFYPNIYIFDPSAVNFADR